MEVKLVASEASTGRQAGVGLALSGGGFRATLFQFGSLWRLNELGWLKHLKEVTSVSGGSITAGLLGLRWPKLSFDAAGVATNFVEVIADPLREFCGHTIDVGSILAGLISPFRHPSAFIIARYKEKLFGDATLEALPADGAGPRYTIYATSLQTGASMRFSRGYMAEYLLGCIWNPKVPLALAVAASSAFPPPLCPVTLDIDPKEWEPLEGAILHGQDLSGERSHADRDAQEGAQDPGVAADRHPSHPAVRNREQRGCRLALRNA